MVFLYDKICKITNFTKIKYISENKVEIILKKRILIVFGDDLTMSFYSKEEITIKGKVKKIEFYDNV